MSTPQFELKFRLDSVAAVGGILIAVQFFVRLALVSGSYFWQDDFAHLALARTMGLSQDYLLRDYNDHLEIGPFFVYWLASQDASTSFWPATLSIVAMQLAASWLLWMLLRELFGSSPMLLVPLTLYLFTPLTLASVTWWASALEALPLQISMLGAALGMARYYRTRAWKWAVASWLAYAAGLLFWEKAIVVLLVSAAVFAVFIQSGNPLRERFAAFVSLWKLWAGHLVLLVAYVALYVSVVDGTPLVSTTAREYLSSGTVMVFRVFIPGLFGGPWNAGGAENTLFPNTSNLLAFLFLGMAAAVVAASVLVSGRRAIAPWVLLLGYLLADLTLMLTSRSQFLGLVTRDPRYITDAAPIAALAVAGAFAMGSDSVRSPLGQRLRGLSSLSTAVAACSVLAASSLITTYILAPVVQHRYAENFTKGVITRIQMNPGVGIVNTDVPGGVSGMVDYRTLLRAVGEDVTLNEPGTELFMFDSLSDLREVEIRDTVLSRRGPEKDCGWPVRRAPVDLGDVPSEGPKGRVLRVGYVTGVPATIHVEIDGHEQSLPVESGLGYAWFVYDGVGGQLTTWVTDSTDGVCVSDIAVGQPWPAES